MSQNGIPIQTETSCSLSYSARNICWRSLHCVSRRLNGDSHLDGDIHRRNSSTKLPQRKIERRTSPLKYARATFMDDNRNGYLIIILLNILLGGI